MQTTISLEDGTINHPNDFLSGAPMPERTKYQESIIRNYYRNQDDLMLQRLGELVTNLYLAEGKSRAKHWKAAATALAKVGVPATRIEHLVAQDKPELLAKLLDELLKKG